MYIQLIESLKFTDHDNKVINDSYVNKYLNTCYCNFISNIVLGTCTDPGIKVLNKYNDEPKRFHEQYVFDYK